MAATIKLMMIPNHTLRNKTQKNATLFNFNNRIWRVAYIRLKRFNDAGNGAAQLGIRY